MQETPLCFHNLEWPAPGATVAGPVVWLRGWIVGKPGWTFCDVRVHASTGRHLGLLGLPRTDLAAHFGSPRPWLPAEFVIGVPLPDGPTQLALEAQDLDGNWHQLHTLALTVSPAGERSPRVDGHVVPQPDGSRTERTTHAPLRGSLDLPTATPVLHHGRTAVFGWLLHDSVPLSRVLATTDLLVFNHLEHHLADPTLAAQIAHPAAGSARLRGEVDLPPTLSEPACLRIYAETGDGSAYLAFAQRLTPQAIATPPPTQTAYVPVPPRTLPTLPSGRPRRALFVLRTLHADDATWRALDLARHLTGTAAWALRIVCAEDGPLRHRFEQAGLAVQCVDPQPFFGARDAAAAQSALAELGRQIWWRHLDAVAVFDPLCSWALALARQAGLPTLFDCSTERPFAPDAAATEPVARVIRHAWRSATHVCVTSPAVAAAQAGALAGTSLEVIPHWHTAELPPPQSGAGLLAEVPIAPQPAQGFATLMRAAIWLDHRHGGRPAWHFFLSRGQGTAREHLAWRDRTALPPDRLALAPPAGASAALCLNPAPLDGSIRALLDAAAAGVPVLTVASPAIRDYFTEADAGLIPADQPLALAHALLDLAANPGAAARRAAHAQRRIRHDYAPGPLLARWQSLLASAAATRR